MLSFISLSYLWQGISLGIGPNAKFRELTFYKTTDDVIKVVYFDKETGSFLSSYGGLEVEHVVW